MTYKLIASLRPNEDVNVVLRLSDNTFIPFDPANNDYQAYLEWLAEGNEPLPPDEPETP